MILCVVCGCPACRPTESSHIMTCLCTRLVVSYPNSRVPTARAYVGFSALPTSRRYRHLWSTRMSVETDFGTHAQGLRYAPMGVMVMSAVDQSMSADILEQAIHESSLRAVVDS